MHPRRSMLAAMLPAICLVAASVLSACTTPPSARDAPQATSLRVVTANIRHGRGMDDRVDLERTAGVLAALAPDIVALQEVDRQVARSGGVDQAAELGRRLGMHAAFGAFMPLGEGEYGCAILSRHPIVASRSIRLPDGHEPRVALEAIVELPGGERIAVVCIHLDWVDDDRFRFAQATEVARHLAPDRRSLPTVLLGDFNDQPGSRTIALLRSLGEEATKPEGGRLTFPSTAPEIEIDFIVGVPAGAWVAREVRVIDERIASDHRPVLAVLERRSGG